MGLNGMEKIKIKSKIKEKTNKPSRNRIIDTENVVMVAGWEGGQGNGQKR